MDVFVEDTFISGIMTTIFIALFKFICFAVGLYPTPEESEFYAHIDKISCHRQKAWVSDLMIQMKRIFNVRTVATSADKQLAIHLLSETWNYLFHQMRNLRISKLIQALQVALQPNICLHETGETIMRLLYAHAFSCGNSSLGL